MFSLLFSEFPSCFNINWWNILFTGSKQVNLYFTRGCHPSRGIVSLHCVGTSIPGVRVQHLKAEPVTHGQNVVTSTGFD